MRNGGQGVAAGADGDDSSGKWAAAGSDNDGSSGQGVDGDDSSGEWAATGLDTDSFSGRRGAAGLDGDAFSGRRAVVTGGAGFVGSHLCDRLRDLGAVVTCLDNLLTGSLENLADRQGDPQFTFVRHDICEPFDVSGPVDFVFHLASPASPHDYLRHPVATLRAGAHGAQNALDLALRKGARFLLASTSEVYGDPLVHPQVETYWGNVNPVGPRSVYDEAKRFAEALTTAYRTGMDADTVIVRLFNTYGPRMRPHDGRAVPTFITQAQAGKPLTVAGDGTQTRSLCYVDDTVTGILTAARSGHPGPINIGNPAELTIIELAARIRELCASKSLLTFIDRPVDDPFLRRPDIGLARAVLGWQPSVEIDKGLAMTIDWFAARGD